MLFNAKGSNNPEKETKLKMSRSGKGSKTASKKNVNQSSRIPNAKTM